MTSRKNRDDITLASKVVGPNPGFDWIREGNLGFDKANIKAALEKSLQRLQTDRIDLYQLHWPERNVNIMGQRNYKHKPEQDDFDFLETIQTLDELMKEGKIRYYGLSNETPWGTMKYLQIADANNLPRPISVQNCYNLLNRCDEIGLTEILLRENVPMLPYSPLAMGVLSGKYQDGEGPAEGRLNKFGDYFSRYKGERVLKATQHYVDLAKKLGITPAQMALAFVNQQPFVGSNIIGATSIKQLKENLSSVEVKLDDKTLAEIDSIHEMYTNPCP